MPPSNPLMSSVGKRHQVGGTDSGSLRPNGRRILVRIAYAILKQLWRIKRNPLTSLAGGTIRKSSPARRHERFESGTPAENPWNPLPPSTAFRPKALPTYCDTLHGHSPVQSLQAGTRSSVARGRSAIRSSAVCCHAKDSREGYRPGTRCSARAVCTGVSVPVTRARPSRLSRHRALPVSNHR